MEDMKKKLTQVYSKLSMVDQMLLNNYINKESERIVREIAQEVDYCISATLIEAFPQLSSEEIRVILDKSLEYKEDQHKKAIAIRKEHGKEIEKFVDKMGDKIIERTKQLIKEGVNQNNALKLLKNEFKGIPNASIVNYYKSAKEEYKANNSTPEYDKIEVEVAAAAEYILSEIPPASERVATVEPTTEFKILSKSLELEGNYDKYKVENKKLIVKNIEYNSLEDLEEMYGSEINAIAKELEIARNRLIEAKKVFNEFIM